MEFAPVVETTMAIASAKHGPNVSSQCYRPHWQRRTGIGFRVFLLGLVQLQVLTPRAEKMRSWKTQSKKDGSD